MADTDQEIREGPALKNVWPFRGFWRHNPAGLGFGPKIRGGGVGRVSRAPTFSKVCFESKERPSYRGLRPRFFFQTVCGSFNVPTDY